MPVRSLRIATRKSLLALIQSSIVKKSLEKLYPDLSITIIPVITTGDQLLEQSLSNIGGKGLFIKEIEQALLENRADIAVHSMKDIPVQLTPDLEFTAFLSREDARDVFISNEYKQLSEMPSNSVVGTASLRREGMIKCLHPAVQIKLLRGNIDTRLAKLERQDYNAIILAAAGLHRLGLAAHIQAYFSLEESLPAVGQGIIGIQCRTQDKKY